MLQVNTSAVLRYEGGDIATVVGRTSRDSTDVFKIGETISAQRSSAIGEVLKTGSPARFDDFSLGNYGLYLGDGYILHGTIFQSLLGRRVTADLTRRMPSIISFSGNTVRLKITIAAIGSVPRQYADG